MSTARVAARDTGPLYVVVPGDVDDLDVPSGGNAYDRRMAQGLTAIGRPVREIAVPGGWPRPEEAARVRLARALAEVPDGRVVLLDGLVACGVPDIVVPQARRLRLAVVVHLPLGDESGLEPGVAARLDALERETLRGVSMVVATSRWAAHRLIDHHGLVADRVRAVPPGTDFAPPAPGTDGVSRLLCVASVTPRKGHDLLVDALAELTDLPWSCVCVGPASRDPDYVAGLRERIARHGLADRVRFTGPLAGARLDAAYAAADLMVLASRAETYGMVVTEALARGIPVLATAVGGVPEALGQAPDGSVPGILVPPHDSGQLADGLRRWLGEPDLRRRLRLSARRRRGMTQGWEGVARGMAAELELLRAEGCGEPAFTKEWLDLREGADSAARATRLLDALPDRPADEPMVIRDLGCGTGSLGRWLAGRMSGPQHWILHDRDPELLARAGAGLPRTAADGSPVTVETREGDLTGLRAADLAGTHLVTASALLDLLSREEVDALAAACVAAGCPALLTLSVAGRVELRPPDPLDAGIAAAFDAHQRRDAGGRRLLGPDAVAAATEAFERRGATVLDRPSPWRLGPDQAPLTREWLRGWVGAAVEQRPDLADRADAYLRRRLGACAAGGLSVLVGHRDLLALPPSPGGGTA